MESNSFLWAQQGTSREGVLQNGPLNSSYGAGLETSEIRYYLTILSSNSCLLSRKRLVLVPSIGRDMQRPRHLALIVMG